MGKSAVAHGLSRTETKLAACASQGCPVVQLRFYRFNPKLSKTNM